MASIREVAQEAGVGVGTVSRALNGSGYVSPEGNGLGLPLVKRILELHKGEVAVRSRAGEGSVFVVRVLTDGK